MKRFHSCKRSRRMFPNKGPRSRTGHGIHKKVIFPKAIEYLKKASAEDPRNGEAIAVAGSFPIIWVDIRQMRFRCWRKCKAGIRGERGCRVYSGNLLHPSKNYPQARAAFARMFDVAPDSAASYMFRRECCCARSSIQSPRSTRKKPRLSIPSCRWFIFYSAIVFVQIFGCQEAIAEFQKELGINPGHAATYYKLADALLPYSKNLKMPKRVLANVRYGLTPHRPGLSFLWEKILEKKGEFELAVRSLQRAATMDPNNPTTHHLLGQALSRHGEKKKRRRAKLKLAGAIANSTRFSSISYCRCAVGRGRSCSASNRSTASFGKPCNSSRNAALVQPKPTTFILYQVPRGHRRSG